MGAEPKNDAAGPEPSILRQILYGLLLFFAETYDNVIGLSTGPPLHDPVAVAVLLSNLNPAMDLGESSNNVLRFSDNGGERFLVNIVTDGQHGAEPLLTGQLGRTIVKPIAGGRMARGTVIPREVDVDAFWNIMIDCLQRADQWNDTRLERVSGERSLPGRTMALEIIRD